MTEHKDKDFEKLTLDISSIVHGKDTIKSIYALSLVLSSIYCALYHASLSPLNKKEEFLPLDLFLATIEKIVKDNVWKNLPDKQFVEHPFGSIQ